MNHDDRIRQFNEDVDRLLREPNAPIRGSDSEYDEMIGLARVLASADLERLSRNREAARRRLVQERPGMRWFRPTVPPMVAEAVAVLLLIAAVLTVPPLRATAQEVVRSIGQLLFTRQPTPAQERFADEGELRFDDVAAPEYVTLAEAQARLDWGIMTPGYLPEGLALHNVELSESEAGTTLTLRYGGPYLLTISQVRHDGPSPVELPLGSEVTPQPVTVRGTEAAWLEGVPNAVGGLASEEDPDVIGQRLLFYDNLLMWEEDGVTFTARANGSRPPEGDRVTVTSPEPVLPLTEIIRIADSLRPLE